MLISGTLPEFFLDLFALMSTLASKHFHDLIVSGIWRDRRSFCRPHSQACIHKGSTVTTWEQRCKHCIHFDKCFLFLVLCKERACLSDMFRCLLALLSAQVSAVCKSLCVTNLPVSSFEVYACRSSLQMNSVQTAAAACVTGGGHCTSSIQDQRMLCFLLWPRSKKLC